MTDVDDVATVVLAPNPGPMTLDGTNTYVLGAPDHGEVVVVDPGPDDPVHRRAVEASIRRRDAVVAAVVLTHHHVDHAEAALWAAEWQAPLLAHTPELLETEAQQIGDGHRLRRAGVTLVALHTPGHASDHLCLRVEETGAVLTGDHVLGRGTSVVAWPDGDMGAYLHSLRRLADVPATVLYPGHGPVLTDPARTIAEYIAHRLEREHQVLDVLEAGPATPSEIVAVIYADVDVALHPAAERSVRAHLDKLLADRRVQRLVQPSRPDRQETYRVR